MLRARNNFCLRSLKLTPPWSRSSGRATRSVSSDELLSASTTWRTHTIHSSQCNLFNHKPWCDLHVFFCVCGLTWGTGPWSCGAGSGLVWCCSSSCRSLCSPRPVSSGPPPGDACCPRSHWSETSACRSSPWSFEKRNLGAKCLYFNTERDVLATHSNTPPILHIFHTFHVIWCLLVAGCVTWTLSIMFPVWTVGVDLSFKASLAPQSCLTAAGILTTSSTRTSWTTDSSHGSDVSSVRRVDWCSGCQILFLFDGWQVWRVSTKFSSSRMTKVPV